MGVLIYGILWFILWQLFPGQNWEKDGLREILWLLYWIVGGGGIFAFEVFYILKKGEFSLWSLIKKNSWYEAYKTWKKAKK